MDRVAALSLPPRGVPTALEGGHNQRWPTSGPGGYITLATWGAPTALGGMFARRALGTRPARYLSMMISTSARDLPSDGEGPPNRPRWTAHLPYKARCIIRQ